MRTFFTLAVSLIFSLTAAQTKIDKSFPVSNKKSVKFKFDYPQLIKISTWDQNRIHISGSVVINENESNNAFEINESNEGNVWTISGAIPALDKIPRRIKVTKGNEKIVFKNKEELQKYSKENNATFDSMSDGADISIELEIKVPVFLKTYVEATYGLVEVRDFRGDISVNALYGGVDATIEEKKAGKIVAETYFGQIYSNLDTKLSGKEIDDFHTSVSATPGTGSQYNLESKYGNIYLRK